MIQRYGLVWEGMDVKNDKRDDAPYVLYTDHLAAVAEKNEQIAALEKKVDEFDKEICRWASKAKVAEKQIAAKNDLLYVYQNTPFAHWRERALKAEERVAVLTADNKLLREALEKLSNWNTGHYDDASDMKEIATEALRGGEVKG